MILQKVTCYYLFNSIQNYNLLNEYNQIKTDVDYFAIFEIYFETVNN